jgi:hypothetical protein
MMYYSSDDMLEALMRYGVSAMGIQSCWDYLAVEDGKQWCSDNFHIEETK